ncbi:MAG: dipeptidyl-peptidase 3 family protein, partial [Thermoanaerobaculia bacterium]
LWERTDDGGENWTAIFDGTYTRRPGAESTELAVVSNVAERLARYAPVEIAADLAGVPVAERPVLVELIRAGRLMDEIFLRQVTTENSALEAAVAAMPEAVRTYFDVNFGPWDRIDEMEPWLGATPHPPGAGYYPLDMTKEEFEAWVAAHPEDKGAFEGLYHVIRRRDGGLVAVPYSQEYGEWLVPAAAHLRSAAAATGNASLRRFLELQAAAFAADDYYQSDLAWMELDSPVEVTIGPYEVYEDGLFAYKAAFEAFVTVEVPAESAKLARFKELLPALETNLPIPEEHKNPNRGSESPIRVVDVVFSGGDTTAGIQTIAFNLPNDERVRAAKGSKKVLLRNVIQAKYDRILTPIAERTLTPDQAALVSFDAFLAEVLHHELAHGLGPGFITVDGRQTEVRLELKDLYAILEEAKADVMGIYDLLSLMEQGEVPAELRASLEPTYVAGLFRSARFGVHEAHGRGVIAQFNYLLEKGALEVDAEGRFRSVSELFPDAIRDLLHDMLMLQATGDYVGTAAFLEKYGHPSPALLAAIDRLADVPVDIRPIYTQAAELAP